MRTSEQPSVWCRFCGRDSGWRTEFSNFCRKRACKHLGLFRDEKTLEPVEYYIKFSGHKPVDIAFVLDPMLAIGGSACVAVA